MRTAILIFAAAVAGFAGAATAESLNYDELIPLDAEALAETGVKAAYDELLPTLRKYVPAPAEIHERIDSDVPSYSVSCLGTNYPIYDKHDQDESWGRATFALFDSVNRQLAKAGSQYRFFAINAGNELGAMFLKPEQAEAAKQSLARKVEWPYLPVDRKPWYGQSH
jgi:hypothetical protein